jgi:uncharacterized protein YsxB (DUF464 family)
MIHIRVQEKDGRITEISISGHAEADEHGRDLVCAAVSAVGFGLCNALDEMTDKAGFEVSEGNIRIWIPEPDETAEIILRTGLYQFETIAEVNDEFIEIKRRSKK